MRSEWEEKFKKWKKPPSDTEESKCANAERLIKEAIEEHPDFDNREIEVFAKGSYQNNTNVRLDSDVDISVCLKSVFFTDFNYSKGLTRSDLGFVDSDYKFEDFKADVIIALENKFEKKAVKRGNKSIKIRGNTYRIVADAVPALEKRTYLPLGPNGEINYVSGVEIISDDGKRIENFPKHEYTNGVTKNKATGNNFKFLVRILKRLRNEMQENSIPAAQNIASFLIESLLYNVPNDHFSVSTYYEELKSSFIFLYSKLKDEELSRNLLEVNEIKFIFFSSQAWTRKQALDFVISAYNYVFGGEK